jgi:integrase
LEGLGDRVRLIREKAKINQVELARKLGVEQNSVSRVEHGKHSFSVDILASFAREFNVDLNWLITGESRGYFNGAELFVDRMHYEATYLTALTGMRAGEVRALQWQDIDFAASVIYVQRAFKSWSGESGPPKWGKTRTVPLPAPLADLLRPRVGKPDAWVFGRSGADPLGYSRLAAAFKRAAKKAGLPPEVTLHSLRHSLQTALRESGLSDELLRASFGWSSPAVQDGYTHRELYQTGPQADAVNKLLGGTNGK